MKPVVKGVIIGCAVVAVLGIVFVGGIFWFVKTKGPGLVQGATSARNEGETFGRNKSEPECLAAAMARHRDDRSMMATVGQGVWLNGCLETSAIDAQFCTSVPTMSEFRRTVSWRLAKCGELGFGGDSTCQSILQQVQTYCESPKRKEKMSAPQPQ